VAHASEAGVEYLSLYTFSTENWRRTEEEVSYLMGLIKSHLRKQYDFYRQHNIKVIHSGDLMRLPDAVREEILLAEEDTVSFSGMKVNLLINYGGRDEIVRAARRYIQTGLNSENISETDIRDNFDHPEIPDLDLLIRTGGEMRLSNFMIWQSAYAELYFSDLYWPDFNSSSLDEAFNQYKKRQRRFGGNPA
jgi:undecaprenyl diphosphate synthase